MDIELPLLGLSPLNASGQVRVQLGREDWSCCTVRVVRAKPSGGGHFFGFRIDEPDEVWRRCVAALDVNFTARDLVQ